MVDKVRIHPSILEELESVFPECIDETDVNTLLVNSGKRAVIHYMRNRIRQQETRANDKEPSKF